MVVWNIPHDDPHEYVSSNVPMAAIQEKEEGGGRDPAKQRCKSEKRGGGKGKERKKPRVAGHLQVG